MSEQPKFNIDEELSAIKSNVMTRWKDIEGTEPDDAMKEYMMIMKNWPGFGSTVFNVTTKDASFPTPDLSLGVSFSHVAIYRRDETRPLATYNYEDILSFGAPQPNVYRIMVQDRSPIQFETDKRNGKKSIFREIIRAIILRTCESAKLHISTPPSFKDDWTTRNFSGFLVCPSPRADWSQTPLKSPVSELLALSNQTDQADMLSYLKSEAFRKQLVNGSFDILVVTTVVEIARLMKAYINEIVKVARRKSLSLRDSLQLIGDEENVT